MLKKRILSAIFLIAAFLFILIYFSSQLFCLLISIIMLFAAWEWTKISEIKKVSSRIFYLIIVASLLILLLFVPLQYFYFLFIATFIWWIIAFLLIISFSLGDFSWGKSIFLRATMGLFVLIPCWAALNDLRNQTQGVSQLIFLFFLIWGADSAAYFAGKKWGKHHLAPRVSPGKTIEGLMGALIFAFVFSLFVQWFAKIPWSQWWWGIVLSLITVLFSVVGDLFESMIKRVAHLKDSGNVIPGHGGVLDRIDSLTAAVPIFTLGALLQIY